MLASPYWTKVHGHPASWQVQLGGQGHRAGHEADGQWVWAPLPLDKVLKGTFLPE